MKHRVILLYLIIFEGLLICSLPDKLHAQFQDINNETTKKNKDFSYTLYTSKSKINEFKSSIPESEKITFSHENSNLFDRKLIFCELIVSYPFGESSAFIINCPNIRYIQIELENTDSLNNLGVINIKPVKRSGQYIFELHENAERVIIKAFTSQFESFTIEKKDKTTIFAQERVFTIFYGISLGIIILQFLYNLILFFIVKDKLYFYFIGLSGLLGIYLAQKSGFILYGALESLCDFIYFVAIPIGFLLVTVSYLKLIHINRQLYSKLIQGIPFVFIIYLLFLVKPSLETRIILLIVNTIIIISFILLTLKYPKENKRSSILFILAWAVLLIFTVIHLVSHFIKLEGLFIIDHALELGLISNNIILALTIGNKLNIYKEEKSHAELLEFKALEKKEILVQEQNEILMKLISERNKELLEKISISERQRKEIELQNERISSNTSDLDTINQQLEAKNREIQKQNQELVNHHKLLEKTVKKRTKKLTKTRNRAIKAEKLKTSFLNNLTQEINTPMNAITGFAGLITDKELNIETRNTYLLNINKYVDQLLESVDNIVILSRLQTGMIKIKRSETSVNELLKTVQNKLLERARQIKSEVEIKFNNKIIEKELRVEMDANKTHQLFLTLFDTIANHSTIYSFTIESTHIENSETNIKNQLLEILLHVKSADPEFQSIKSLFIKFFKQNETFTKYDNPVIMGIAITKGFLKVLKSYAVLEESDVDELKIRIQISVRLVVNIESQ